MKFVTLREARQNAELSQDGLASASGIDQAVISKLELGKIANPSFDTVKKLAEALDIDPRQLQFDGASEKQTRLPLRKQSA